MDLSMDLHNKYRNEIATGKVSPYPMAARMATLVSENDGENVDCF